MPNTRVLPLNGTRKVQVSARRTPRADQVDIVGRQIAFGKRPTREVLVLDADFQKGAEYRGGAAFILQLHKTDSEAGLNPIFRMRGEGLQEWTLACTYVDLRIGGVGKTGVKRRLVGWFLQALAGEIPSDEPRHFAGSRQVCCEILVQKSAAPVIQQSCTLDWNDSRWLRPSEQPVEKSDMDRIRKEKDAELHRIVGDLSVNFKTPRSSGDPV